MKAGDLRPIGRDTQGVRLMDLAEGDRIVSLATLAEPVETAAVAEGGEPDEAVSPEDEPPAEE
jgi:hypothetical protein